MKEHLDITLNETALCVPQGTTLHALRAQHKPDADVVIVNGFPVSEDQALAPGDAVVLIRRGEPPGADTLEALLVARHSPGVHGHVKNAVVGIAGAGGLGSAVAVALARMGIGRLILADFDVVEPSNLNRQQYFVEQIGLPKVDALAENLRRINPYVQLAAHALRLTQENVPLIFADAAILVEAFDHAGQKAMLAETFATAYPDRPIVLATGLAGYGPGNEVRVRRAGRNVIVVGDEATAAAPGTGLMAPRVGIAAHQQANAVLRLLLGEDPVA